MEMTKLLVKDLMNGKFELFSDYVYKTKEYLIKVPKGFVTDYASIPKLLRAIVLPYGKHSGASVVLGDIKRGKSEFCIEDINVYCSKEVW